MIFIFVVEKNPRSIEAEMYASLRTNLEYLAYNESLKSILITSSEVSEGKTTIGGNLAISLTKNGKNAILVDCNLRKPSIYKCFDLENVCGVSDLLLGNVLLKDVIKEVGKGLHVITAGNMVDSPSEILCSEKIDELIGDLENSYDYVILDAPPILSFADSQILASKVQGTVLIIRAEKTKRKDIIDAKSILDKIDAKIIGVVLNGVKTKKKTYRLFYKDIKEKKSKKAENVITEGLNLSINR